MPLSRLYDSPFGASEYQYIVLLLAHSLLATDESSVCLCQKDFDYSSLLALAPTLS